MAFFCVLQMEVPVSHVAFITFNWQHFLQFTNEGSYDISNVKYITLLLIGNISFQTEPPISHIMYTSNHF